MERNKDKNEIKRKGTSEKLKGNRNAVKTGEHVSIFYSTLEEEEQKDWDEMQTDVIATIEEEIKLTTIREKRMMQRIQELKEHNFTVVEINKDQQLTMAGKIVEVKNKKALATLGQIQNIEEALSRVQDRKARIIDLKLKAEQIDKGDLEEDDAMDALTDILEASKRIIRQNKVRVPKKIKEAKDD
jgi:uncharacterized protein YjcR